MDTPADQENVAALMESESVPPVSERTRIESAAALIEHELAPVQMSADDQMKASARGWRWGMVRAQNMTVTGE